MLKKHLEIYNSDTTIQTFTEALDLRKSHNEKRFSIHYFRKVFKLWSLRSKEITLRSPQIKARQKKKEFSRHNKGMFQELTRKVS